VKNDIKPKLLVIAGPTASGKSDLAVVLAKKFDGEVISADSRQVYRGMDLGTGKITKREMMGVPHHLLDVASPRGAHTSGFSVNKFQKKARAEIKKIIARGKLPIICGGTGFYIQSITDNLVLPAVKPNVELRKKLAKKSAAELATRLKKLDPERWEAIDRQNPHRLIRAIEIASALGQVPKLDLAVQPPKEDGFDLLIIGLKPDPNTLKEKIHIRLRKRLHAGMLAEVKRLRESGVSWGRLEGFGLEYKWQARFLQNKISKTEMITGLEKDINSFAKRQDTWFKRDQRIHWLKKPADATRLVQIWLNK
jgi:tRNA dimethylallyltransferase